MPALQRFGPICIRMYPGDHRPPHFHVVGPDFEVAIAIEGLSTIAGRARSSQVASALAWAAKNQDFLRQVWHDLSERE